VATYPTRLGFCLSPRRLRRVAFPLSALLTRDGAASAASGEALAKAGFEPRALYEP